MQDHDWIFDVVLDVCEKAEQFGLPGVSAKLEEVLDAYLEETGSGCSPATAGDTEVASFGPISLGQETYVLGKNSSERLTELNGSETSGESQSEDAQQPLFIRSTQKAGQQGDDPAQVDILLDKAG